MIKRKDEFDRMDDPSYLKNILSKSPVVNIITRDEAWRREIKLPQIAPQQGEIIRIIFNIKSTLSVLVRFEHEELRLEKGMRRIFENVSGKWILTASTSKKIDKVYFIK